jgi:SAM-dependent methyltransferase
MADTRWPPGFARVPDDQWVRRPPEALALTYDAVRDHGWYRNLDRTVADLARALRPDDILLDYSGGTGILAKRLLSELPDPSFGILIVDASPKFLRVALEKLGDDERVAFRLLRYLKDERRLQTVQEVLEPTLLERGVDVLSSTNAIHLYYDLDDTLRSWHTVLRRGGRILVQSGNIGVPDLPADTWIIDETVERVNQAALEIVRTDDRYEGYRAALADDARMASYDELRHTMFLPVRPLADYVEALERAGFDVVDIAHVPVEASLDEWADFLATYHEGVLGWLGGAERIEGVAATDEAVADRLRLLRESVARVFGTPTFRAVWTYIEAVA